MNDFIVYPKTGRMIGLGLLSVVFVLLGAVFLGISIVENGPIWLGIIGVVTILFFGMCMIYYVKEIINRQPVLKVSKVGIMDRSSLIGAGEVKWEDIADIDFINYGGQVFLGVYTHDPELIINRSNGIKSMLNNLNKNLIDAQVNIPVKNLDCATEELVEVINKHWAIIMNDTEIEPETR